MKDPAVISQIEKAGLFVDYRDSEATFKLVEQEFNAVAKVVKKMGSRKIGEEKILRSEKIPTRQRDFFAPLRCLSSAGRPVSWRWGGSSSRGRVSFLSGWAWPWSSSRWPWRLNSAGGKSIPHLLPERFMERTPAGRKSSYSLGALSALRFFPGEPGLSPGHLSLAVLLCFEAIETQRWPVVIFGSVVTSLITYAFVQLWLQVQLPAGLWGI